MRLDKTNFKNQEKKLKKMPNEQETLEKILIHTKQCENFSALNNSPVSYMYGFEAKREDLKGFYGFNLEKNGGAIRLICSFDIENNVCNLEYISLDHYKDFKRNLKVNKGKYKQKQI